VKRLLSVILLPASALAQDVSTLAEVVLSVEGCPEEWPSILERQLRIEVDALVRERRSDPGPDLDQVTVLCAGDEVQIRVRVRSGAQQATTLDRAGSDPDALLRAVALSTTELVATLWAEPIPDPPARPAPPRPRVAPHSEPMLLVGASAHRTGTPGAWLLGPTVAVELPLTRALVPMLDLRGDFGSARTSVAPVSIQAGSAGAHLLIGSQGRRWRWGAGPGLRVGWAELRGDPTFRSGYQSARVGGVFLGPSLAARFGYALARPLPWIGVVADGGLITRSVTGTLDTAPALYAVDGAWLGLTLWVGASW
jgi:hypothetical protein